MNNEKYRRLTTIVRSAWWFFIYFCNLRNLENDIIYPQNCVCFLYFSWSRRGFGIHYVWKGFPPLNPKSWIPFKHNGFIGWSKMCIRHAVQTGTSSKNLQIIFSACELSYGLTDYSRCRACVLRGLSSFSFRFSFLSCRIRLLLSLYKRPYHRRGHDLEVG